ncbi:MAG: amidohydrolase family protein [Acidimicrobiia bacterium]
MTHDLLVRGGLVVDGSGGPRRPADVAVDDGRIVAVGRGLGPARRVVEAEGRIVAPGFVDVHTHLDVQGFWDPMLTPSPLHGVTTALGGNCGFTVAPLDGDAAPYLMRMLAKVEGMPLTSLERGVPWDWGTTAEFLDRLEGRLALNTGFSVGHSALRRVVMGPDATERHATPDELAAMLRLLHDGLSAGALGFSSTWSPAHNDHDGRPVPSRAAAPSELVALAAACRDHPGTSLEFLAGAGEWDAATRDVIVDMSVAAGRPLNWNVISGTAESLDRWLDKLAVSDLARARGGKVVGLALPRSPAARFCMRSGFALDALVGWDAAMALPDDEKLALLTDPDGRRRLAEDADRPSAYRHLADWGGYRIMETFSPDTERFEGRVVADIARDLDKDPFDALVDIVVADELRTSFCIARPDDTADDWAARARLWRDPRVVVGASDAGAHLDMLTTYTYPTDLLGLAVREHGLLGVEEAVRMLTAEPAELYGLRDRGVLRPGAWADVVVFDQDEVGPGEITTRFDLPGGAGRLYAGADGVGHVIVNGVPIVEDGELTASTPGRVLRAGRDTATPSLD